MGPYELPNPIGKPLSKRRKANILHWHMSKNLKKVLPPVDAHTYDELVAKSRVATNCRIVNNNDVNDKFVEEGHRISKRFIKRRYRRLLLFTPKMESHDKNFSVEWYDLDEEVPVMNAQDMEGVDKQGRVK
jgi:hypothetical protein